MQHDANVDQENLLAAVDDEFVVEWNRREQPAPALTGNMEAGVEQERTTEQPALEWKLGRCMHDEVVMGLESPSFCLSRLVSIIK